MKILVLAVLATACLNLEIQFCPNGFEDSLPRLNLTTVDCSASLEIWEANRLRMVHLEMMQFQTTDEYIEGHSTCVQSEGQIYQEVSIERINQSFAENHMRMKIAEYCFRELSDWIREIMADQRYRNYQDMACSGRTRIASFIETHSCKNWRIVEN